MKGRRVEFIFPRELAEVAKEIIENTLVAKAIATHQDEIGECRGYEVRLSENNTGSYDLVVYPLVEVEADRCRSAQ